MNINMQLGSQKMEKITNDQNQQQNVTWQVKLFNTFQVGTLIS